MLEKSIDKNEKKNAFGNITPHYRYKGRSKHHQHCFAMRETKFKRSVVPERNEEM